MKKLDGRANAADPARPGGTAPSDVWRPHGRGNNTRAIASLIPRITQKSFEKHGFAAASLIMDWAQIVGHERARNTRPLKLKWPRTLQKFSKTDENLEGRPGATLVLQVDPAIALDIQYQSGQLIERVNAYFGYRAVANLRLIQEAIGEDANRPDRLSGQSPRAPVMPVPGTSPSQNAPNGLPGGDEDPLSAALARLGAHVAAQIRGRKPD